MSRANSWSRQAAITALLHALPINALPIKQLYKRKLGTGAKAGMGIGIAVVAIFLIGALIFAVIHFRRIHHINKVNKERAILAGEKNPDGSDKPDKFAPKPPLKPSTGAVPRRQKSVKDHLMGPLYRASVIDLMPLPKARIPGQSSNRASTMTVNRDSGAYENMDGVNKPWTQGSESSPRPSFSSKRATRMMMMM